MVGGLGFRRKVVDKHVCAYRRLKLTILDIHALNMSSTP